MITPILVAVSPVNDRILEIRTIGGYVKTFFFFFNDTATTEIYTLSLHDALPISFTLRKYYAGKLLPGLEATTKPSRSEEHTSELQSQSNLVCRLLLEKKEQ